jgi:hypothetical protein
MLKNSWISAQLYEQVSDGAVQGQELTLYLYISLSSRHP